MNEEGVIIFASILGVKAVHKKSNLIILGEMKLGNFTIPSKIS